MMKPPQTTLLHSILRRGVNHDIYIFIKIYKKA